MGLQALASAIDQLFKPSGYTDLRIIDILSRVILTSKPSSSSRRISPRRVTNVKVFAYDGTEIKKCTLRDISLDGAYIEAEGLTLPSGTNLEIVIKIRRDGKSGHCRLPAQVIRVENDGVAVMFGELDEHLFNTLQNLVTAPESSQ